MGSCLLPLLFLRDEVLAQLLFLLLRQVARDELDVHVCDLVVDRETTTAPLSSRKSAEVPSVTFDRSS
jgi:hypothetical protein